MINFWLLLYPDLKRAVGGVKQVHRLAEVLTSLGHHATIVQGDKDFHPIWFESKVNSISMQQWKNDYVANKYDITNNIVILPETYIPYINKYAPRLRKIIFNQNAAYTFGCAPGKDGFPDDMKTILSLYKHPKIEHIICVSHNDANVLIHGLNIKKSLVSTIYNCIETDLFSLPAAKINAISYMPRKNPRDSQIVLSLIQNRTWKKPWTLRAIENCSLVDVSNYLKESLVFMSFGYPEGFGLPLAEALASGCAIIGYHGLGGRDIFEIACKHHVGWPVDYGDWSNFVTALEDLEAQLKNDPKLFMQNLQNASNEIRRTYSFANMKMSVEEALKKINIYEPMQDIN